MDISSQRFENAKRELQESSKNFQVNCKLKKVDTDAGPFGLFNHHVTGEEINELTSNIQSTFINIGNSLCKVQDQFKTVYTLCDAMDNDLIKKIFDNLKLAERGIQDAKDASNAAKQASNAAKFASDDALAANKKAFEAHEKLRKQHEILELTVEKLQEKSLLINSLQRDFSQFKQDDIQVIQDSINSTSEKTGKLQNDIQNLQEKNEKGASEIEQIKFNLAKINEELKNTNALYEKAVSNNTLLQDSFEKLQEKAESLKTELTKSHRKVFFQKIPIVLSLFAIIFSILTFLSIKGFFYEL